MRLRTSHTLSFSGLPAGDFHAPYEIELSGVLFEIPSINTADRTVTLLLTVPVDVETLSTTTGPLLLGGGSGELGIEVPEYSIVFPALSTFVHLLSFITDTPIRHSSRIAEHCLVPDSVDDVARLDALGTRRIHHSLRLSMIARSTDLSINDQSLMKYLGTKEAGLALYSQALLVQEPIATYREFWKILESAFGEKDDSLIRLVALFPPATKLGFEHGELKALLVLRGRASHANSRSGIKELRSVSQLVSAALPRLKCLVEQVILTKKTWGVSSTETEREMKVDSYVRPDGQRVFIRPGISARGK